MNAPRCTDQDYIQFLIASPGPVTCTEAARVQPRSPFAPAHDSFNRLLHRLEPEPEELWQEAEPLVEKAKGVLIIDDSTLDKPYAKKIGLVTRHWSGKHHKPVRGINLITLLWTDGDREIPCDCHLQQGRRQDQARPLLGAAPDGQGARPLPRVRPVRLLVRQLGGPQADPRPRLAL